MVATPFLLAMFLIRHPNKKLIGRMDKIICKTRNVVPIRMAEYCVNGSTIEVTEHTAIQNQVKLSSGLDVIIRSIIHRQAAIERKIGVREEGMRLMDEKISVMDEKISVMDEKISLIREDMRVIREDMCVIREDTNKLKSDMKELQVQVHKGALREAADEVLCVLLDVNALQRLEENHETSLSVKQSLKTMRSIRSGHDFFICIDDESHVVAAKSKLVLGILESLTEEIKQRLKRREVTNLEAILQVVRASLSEFSGSNVPEDIVEYADSFFENTLQVLKKKSTTELM